MIYLDSAATTKPYTEAIDAGLPFLYTDYGNSSSKHRAGIKAKEAIEEARNIIAKTINAKPNEIFFTSGSSEVCSWILWNTFKCFVTDTSHSVFLHDKYSVKIKYDKYPSDLGLHMLGDRTVFCFEHVNNEVGFILDVADICKKCKADNMISFLDATQSYGKIKIDVKKMQVDMLCASAHKFHGIKGVGFLYISEDIQPLYINKPIVYGSQERNMRGGTENVFGIVTMGKAAQICDENLSHHYNKIRELYGRLSYNLFKLGGIHTIVVPNLQQSYYILNCCFDNIDGNQLQSFLNENDICVSTGSACNSHNDKPSHVLKALGLSDKEANSSLRFSFCPENTFEEIDKTIEVVKRGIQLLR